MTDSKEFSDTYTQGSGASVLAVHSLRTATNTCAYFLPLIKPHHRILDVGCGPGSITNTLASYVSKGQVVGVDSSPDIIAAARASASVPSNVAFETGNLMKLAFEDESFDIVHTSQVLLHIPEVVAAFKELRRVCKTGGFVACREADTDAAMISPQHQGLVNWQRSTSLFCKTAGRMLMSWALEAGFEAEKVVFTVGVETHVGEERKLWGEGMARRSREDSVQKAKLLRSGWSESDINEITKGWEAFVRDDGAVYAMPCGQVVCWK